MRIGSGVTAAACAALVAVLGASASPASAKASDGWVRGYDSAGDDWADEGTLSKTSHTRSNAACLWQKILWAEGAKFRFAGQNSDQYFESYRITGIFDDATYRATRALQARWDMDVDGEVGGGTFGSADRKLLYRSGSSDRGEELRLVYSGARYAFDVVRNEDGKYLFKDGHNDWREAGYNYKSCS